MKRKLDQYIKEHSSEEDPVLEDLYRQTYIRFVNPNMVTGHLQGKILELISKMINPEQILEIGTFTGYSTICLAKGLRPGGNLITIELNYELKEFSHSYFTRAGLDQVIVQKTGNAIEIIPSLNMMFDLVYIDGDKREYCDYYKLAKDKVKPGGYIIADNVMWGERVLDTGTTDKQSLGIIDFNNMIMNDKDIEHVIIPFRDGITLIRKL